MANAAVYFPLRYLAAAEIIKSPMKVGIRKVARTAPKVSAKPIKLPNSQPLPEEYEPQPRRASPSLGTAPLTSRDV